MARVFTERNGVGTLKIGLASYRFVNNDMRFNISQIEKGMKAAQGKADLLCFGEAFLQGNPTGVLSALPMGLWSKKPLTVWKPFCLWKYKNSVSWLQ